ncbi:MAG: hypothetical protein R2727_12365 [Bacteroidales bacterium]
MINSIKLDNNIELVSFEGIDKFNALVADEAREILPGISTPLIQR